MSPLALPVSVQLRQSIVYCLINQLWQGLSQATEERTMSLPSDYQEGFLLKEVMALTIILTARLGNWTRPVTPPASAPPRKFSRSKPTDTSSITNSVGYFSISPPPSELGLPVSQYAQLEPIREIYDYSGVMNSTSFLNFLVLRESLLPFYSASNIKVRIFGCNMYMYMYILYIGSETCQCV